MVALVFNMYSYHDCIVYRSRGGGIPEEEMGKVIYSEVGSNFFWDFSYPIKRGIFGTVPSQECQLLMRDVTILSCTGSHQIFFLDCSVLYAQVGISAAVDGVVFVPRKGFLLYVTPLIGYRKKSKMKLCRRHNNRCSSSAPLHAVALLLCAYMFMNQLPYFC